MRPLELTRFDSARDAHPKPWRGSWTTLAAALTTFRVRDDLTAALRRRKGEIDAVLALEDWTAAGDLGNELATLRDRARSESATVADAVERVRRQAHDAAARDIKASLSAWCPATFTGARRARANVDHVHAVVLDMDTGAPIDDEIARWEGHALALHTSWSHRPEHPKFRVVLPLQRPVLGALWPRVFEHLQRLTGGLIDPQTCNADRVFFTPAVPSEAAPRFAHVQDGAWLDIDAAALPKTQAERDADASRRRRRRSRRRCFPDPQSRDRAARRALRDDPEARERFALHIGARIRERASGRVAKGAACPGCGRRSAWFIVDPHRMRSAACAHARSCGWRGPLEDLLNGGPDGAP